MVFLLVTATLSRVFKSHATRTPDFRHGSFERPERDGMNHALRAFVRGMRMDTATSFPGFALAQPLIAGASLLIPSRKIPIAVKISPVFVRTLQRRRA
jgi:hypothetical protein